MEYLLAIFKNCYLGYLCLLCNALRTLAWQNPGYNIGVKDCAFKSYPLLGLNRCVSSRPGIQFACYRVTTLFVLVRYFCFCCFFFHLSYFPLSPFFQLRKGRTFCQFPPLPCWSFASESVILPRNVSAYFSRGTRIFSSLGLKYRKVTSHCT